MLRIGEQVLRLAHLVADVVGKARRIRTDKPFRVPSGGGPLVHVGGGDRSGRTLVSNTDLLSSDTAAGTPDKVAGSNGGATRRRAGLSGMVLAELRELAGQLGITGTTGMRKGDLIAAIKERQGGAGGGGPADTLPLTALPAAKPPRSAAREPKPAIEKKAAPAE